MVIKKTFPLLLMTALLLPASIASPEDPLCGEPTRVVSRDLTLGEGRYYVVQYHEYADHLFVYEEGNGIPGPQTHFDLLAECFEFEVAAPDPLVIYAGQTFVALPNL